MNHSDIFIAFGIPSLVAGIALWALAFQARRRAQEWRLVRQRIEIRLAFGTAREELFRLALSDTIPFEGPVFRTLYALDSHVMRDLDSHQGLATAVSRVILGQSEGDKLVAGEFQEFATNPYTATCAKSHALAFQKLWLEHSLPAKVLRQIPAWVFSLVVSTLQTLKATIVGIRWLRTRSEHFAGWARVQKERLAFAHWVKVLDPTHSSTDGERPWAFGNPW
jgi:hypothetical protein